MRTTSADTKVITVNPTVEAAVLADNDVFIAATEIPLAMEKGPRVLNSIVIIDKDDQAVDCELIFFNDTVTLGTLNSAISISDTDAAKALGAVLLEAAEDTTDLINSTLYTKTGIGLPVEGNALYFAGVIRSGTPDYTASGLTIKFGFI